MIIKIKNVSGIVKPLMTHSFQVDEILDISDREWYEDVVISAITSGDFKVHNHDGEILLVKDQLDWLRGYDNKGVVQKSLINDSGRMKMDMGYELHKLSHQKNGSDEINVNNLSGVLTDQQHIIPSEAVAAMGPKGNGNPLNHDRFQQTEITALPENQLQLNHATHSNQNDPTLAQKQALDASLNPSLANPFLTKSKADSDYSSTLHSHITLPTTNEKAAMQLSESPSENNPFVTLTIHDLHKDNQNNPHNITKGQLGLENVDNTSDIDKPISTSTQSALNEKENTISSGTTSQYYRGDKTWQALNKASVGLGNVDNTSDANKPISNATQTALNNKENVIPTGTTSQYYRGDKTWQALNKAVVGLGSVDNTSDLDKPVSTATQSALNQKINSSLIGVNNGITPLGPTGKIPNNFLPDGYDNVEVLPSISNFPATGQVDVIYIAEDTNLSYRWSGTGYVSIGNSLSLGETSSTAYRGDRGKIAYDHSQLTSGNPHNVTKANVGLGNVDNTSDLSKPVSTATQTALNNKENTVPSGTSSQYYRGDKSWQTLDKSAVGLGNVDNTGDTDKPVSTATQTALNTKENTISAGTTSQYWRGDKTWQILNKASVGLGSVSNDAQLKIASNLSDLNNVSTARTNLELGNSATRNVGTTINDVASGSHNHTTTNLTDFPAKPNNSSENVLTELNNNLIWTPKSGGSSKKTFTWQVHAQNTANWPNSSYFRVFGNTQVCGSDSGWRGTNIYPTLIPFNMKIIQIVLRVYNASFDWRNSSGELYFQIQLLNTLFNQAQQVGKLNFRLPASFTGNSTGNGTHTFVSDNVEASEGVDILQAGMLIGTKFRKDIGREGQIYTISNPHLTIIGEEI